MARNHINLEYTGDEETPLMDRLLDPQLGVEDGRKEALFALIGRLLFPLKKMDNWQVMPLLVGEGGTGKSTVLSVVKKMFRDGAVSEIDNNQEQTFGLQDKWDKELIMITDAPVHMSKVLPQELFQKMVTGESVQVAAKYGSASTVGCWRVPMIVASNTMFDYKDTKGQSTRRVVPFKFSRRLKANEVDGSLQHRIVGEELPNVVARSLGAYHRLLGEAGSGCFWNVCPKALSEAQEDAMMEGNLLHRYLTASPEECSTKTKRVYVRMRKGSVTKWSDFKTAFDAYVKFKHPGKAWTLSTDDVVPLTQLGYTVFRDSLCKSCGAHAVKGCCPEYSSANRTQRWNIYDMELVIEYVGVEGQCAIPD